MQCIREQKGFSLVEVMTAVMVLTLGLTGVAAMQMTAISGTFTANSQSYGSGVAMAWEEWVTGLMRNPSQSTITYFQGTEYADNDRQFPENFVLLSSLDDDPTDTLSDYDPGTMNVFDLGADKRDNPKPFVQVEMPKSTEELVEMFNGERPFVTSDGRSMTLHFRKQRTWDPANPDAYVPFEAHDMPLPAPAGAYMVWRIAANVPVVNTATIEIAIVYANAFTRNRGVALRFIVGATMWGG